MLHLPMFPRYLADVASFFPTGETRNFDYCLRLDNLADYPNYIILAQIGWQGRLKQAFPSPPAVLKPGTCFLMKRYLRGQKITLFAVPKSKVSPDDLFKLEPNTDPIVDRDGNLMGIMKVRDEPYIRQVFAYYFNPKFQKQAPLHHASSSNGLREGDDVWEGEHLGTVLKSAKFLESNGIPASPSIPKPRYAPFWEDGKTIETRYTITTLTDQTFTIKESNNWLGIHLLVLPLLGLILLAMVKWYNRRSQLKLSNNHSETSNNP